MKIKYINLILIILLAFFAGIVVFPAQINKAIDFADDNFSISLPKIKEKDFMFGLDLQGGAYLLYEADLSEIPAGERIERMEGLRNLIERRIDLFGIAESSVQVRGERLAVEIPGAHDLDEAMTIIGETPFLDFREITDDFEEKYEKKWEEIEEHFGKERF